MKREDFVFCIGFSENDMVVDKQLRKKYAKHTTRELFAAGLYKQAFCSALYAGTSEECTWFRNEYSALLQISDLSLEDIKRMFGVYGVPESLGHVIQL